jgi:hypothetical protein
MRTKEDIEENIKSLESAIVGWEEEVSYVESLRDKYFAKYDESREMSTIADALTSYLTEVSDMLEKSKRVLDREKKKLTRLIDKM